MCVTVLLLVGVGAALACPRPNVRISGIAGEEENYNDEQLGNYLPAMYGVTVHIYCLGTEARSLTIDLGGVRQPADVINETAIVTTQLTSELPKTEWYKHSYTCTDPVTTCTASLTVQLLPAIDIISTNVIRKRFNRKVYYFVPINETYQVGCSGYTAKEVTIFKNSHIRLHKEIMNQTAITSSILQEAESVYNDFHCTFDEVYRYLSKYDLSIRVYVDYSPAAENFECVEYKERINCTWDAFSKYATFELYYMDKDRSLRICEDHSGKNIRLCEWNMDDVTTRGFDVNLNFTLVLHTCSRLFCDNQTLFMDRKSIMRPLPPKDIILVNKNANGIIVKMYHERDHFDNFASERITYWIPGVGAREENVEIIDYVFASNDQSPTTTSKTTFKLPCPNTLYKLKIYVKYWGTPDTDTYWSEPTSIVFYTDPQDITDTIDPVCSTEPDLVNTNDRALYMVEKFGRLFKKEHFAMRNKVDALKQKRNKLQKSRTEL